MTKTTTQTIGLVTATIIGMNAMIGAGIFTAPSLIATKVGPAGIITFIIVGIAIWFMGQSFARLAELFPEDGVFYVYAKSWGGHKAGLLASGAYIIGMIVGMGLLAKVTGFYLHEAFPSVCAYWLGLASLVLVTILTSLGVRMSELGQHVLIVLTIFPMLAITLLCFINGSLSNIHPFAPHGIGSILSASQFVVFNFFGFECASLLFSIVRDPEKTIPRALTLAITLVALIYTLFIAAIFLALPWSSFTSPDIAVSELLKQRFPGHAWLISTINTAIIGSILGSIHATLWASSKLVRQFFSKLIIMQSVLKRNFFNQHMIIAFIGLCILIAYVSIDNIGLFFPFVALFVVFAYLMSLIALLFLKNEWKSRQNVLTVMAIITACAILLFSVQGIVQGIKGVR